MGMSYEGHSECCDMLAHMTERLSRHALSGPFCQKRQMEEEEEQEQEQEEEISK